MRTETLGNTSDNAIKEYSSPFTDIDYSKNKIISVRSLLAVLTGTKVQTLTLLLLLQAIDWMPDAKGSLIRYAFAYLTLIRRACISHTQVQILPLLLLQALVWMPGARPRHCQFTCFTGTNVQILTHKTRFQAIDWMPDAKGLVAASLLALLVQTYKY